MQTRGKVLIASGDAMSLSRDLHEAGFTTISANDAVNVLVVARRERPDVILMSSRLPGGGATVALQRLRRNVFTTDVPVVALLHGGASESQLVQAGAQACISSPDDSKAVREAIERHMQQSLDFTQAPADALEAPERIAALNETRLLDTPPEASFDRLTRLASRMLGVDKALVSLVDRDRQFFKSHFGIGEPYATERQTRLSHSFCQWVVADNDALVVGDASEHPVLSRNLAVRDMGVIAYAGVPLAPRDGQAIGSLCAIDSSARRWSDDDIATLRELGTIAEAYALLEMAKRSKAAGDASPATLALTLRVAGSTMLAVRSLVSRRAARLDDADREDLLAILEEQGRHLLDLSAT